MSARHALTKIGCPDRILAETALIRGNGAMDGRAVNIADDATMSVYELVRLTGAKVPSSSVPLPNPWHLTTDVSLARSLGFTPVVTTVYEAQRKGLI
jgi:hypothetical protein